MLGRGRGVVFYSAVVASTGRVGGARRGSPGGGNVCADVSVLCLCYTAIYNSCHRKSKIFYNPTSMSILYIDVYKIDVYLHGYMDLVMSALTLTMQE